MNLENNSGINSGLYDPQAGGLNDEGYWPEQPKSHS
jgi:hypothetical protein